MTPSTDILIIEDDAIMREAMAEWLEAAGYGVRKAADGSAGLAAVKLAPPALVITDIHMPGTNGAVVIAELKQEYPEVSVIAISAAAARRMLTRVKGDAPTGIVGDYTRLQRQGMSRRWLQPTCGAAGA